ncbi:hypothetical protein GP486_006614, partial [Trichoglossum hirsutum]
ELFFSSQWTTAIERSKTSLDPDDLETVESFRSWNNLAAEDLETLGKIPRMVKSLALKAEAFNGYCNEAQVVSNPVKEACFDMQILFTDFFTASIKYIHGAGEVPRHHGGSSHRQESGSPFQLIERRYTTTNHELGEALTRVEKLVRINSPTRVRSPPSTDANITASNLRCLLLPHIKTTRFFDRVDVFEKLDQILGPTAKRTSFRSVALHGLGGVGKSAIASTYIKKKFDENDYDVVLWVCGETPSSLRQSFTDIAMRLKLPGAQPQTHDENTILVQDWFQSTGKSKFCKDRRWLVVYDNVESAATLMPYWPESSQGRAIITTRNHSLAFEPASFGVEVTSWDAQTGSQFLLFLLKKSIGRDLEAEDSSALALSERLSGHALAISHMAGLIYDGEFSIQEFMTMYLKNPRRAHAANEFTALWDFSFKSLDKNSLFLLGVLSYLMPDTIPQELFEAGANQEFSEDLDFCSDDFSQANSLSAALRRLITLALIKRDRDTRVLSIHRMVQTQFKHFLSLEQRQKVFNNTVALVYGVFPREDTAKGQLYEVWETCNRYLQHVLNLKDCFMEEVKMSKNFKALWQFCDLLAQCQRYLYEANALTDLENLCDVNMVAVETLEDGHRKDDLKASIMSHQANLAESLGDAEKAIDLNKRVYEIRLQEKPMKQALLCYVTNNLGYCHNTANDHKSSLEWFQRSRDWWAALVESQGETQGCPPFILKNTARCMVYLNDLKGAEEMLNISIPQLKNAKPLNWAMLAYAYFVQGTLERRQCKFESAEAHFIEAQNSWLEGDQTRLHPFNGGCMYKIGACCLDQGKVEAAIKHIRDSMEVTKFHRKSMPVEHARNLFKLSEALLQDNHDSSSGEWENLRDEAEIYLKRRKPGVVACDMENAYDNLIPIFWR